MLLLIIAVSIFGMPLVVDGEDSMKCLLLKLSLLSYERLYEYSDQIDQFVSMIEHHDFQI